MNLKKMMDKNNDVLLWLKLFLSVHSEDQRQSNII